METDVRITQQPPIRVRDNSYAVDLTTGKQSWITDTGAQSAETVTIVSKPFPYVIDSPAVGSFLREMILVRDSAGHIHMVLNDIRTA